MALASDGTLWVVESAIAAIASISPDGKVTQYRLPDGVLNPEHLALATDSSVWFIGSGFVGLVPPDRKMTVWPDSAKYRVGLPQQITASTNGAIWYGELAGLGAQFIHVASDLTGSYVHIATAFPVKIDGLATSPDGAIWFTFSSTTTAAERVGTFDSAGNSHVWNLPDSSGAGAIVPGPNGTMWLTQLGGIDEVTADGTISSFPTPTPLTLIDLTSGPDGAIWFTTATDVGRLTTSGHYTLWSIPGAQRLDALVYDPQHRGFLLTDSVAAVIRWFSLPR